MPINHHARFTRLLEQIEYHGLAFELAAEDQFHWLRVFCPDGTDSATGEPYSWTARKWMLSPHMTDSEVVQTVFKAVLTAVEHEAREQFFFGGQPIFQPHYDVYALHDLCKRRAVDVRSDPPKEDGPPAKPGIALFTTA